jgi:hypothetical protein
MASVGDVPREKAPIQCTKLAQTVVSDGGETCPIVVHRPCKQTLSPTLSTSRPSVE